MAAKQAGGAPESNPRLRKAIDDAKAVNMPADNIKRAVQRGTGELPGVSYEEITFEGYGPGGTAILVETLTDNKNRTLPEIRTIFSKHGGNLSESGSVRFLFQKKGYIAIEKKFVGRRPQTTCWLSKLGRKSLAGYIDQMAAILHQARTQAARA